MNPRGVNRRAMLQGGSLVLLLGVQEIAFGASIVAVRVWPANDYTRVTIESDGLLSSKSVIALQPPRLAVDIEGLELSPALRELVAKVQTDDPFISGVRVGQFSPNVVRLVRSWWSFCRARAMRFLAASSVMLKAMAMSA